MKFRIYLDIDGVLISYARLMGPRHEIDHKQMFEETSVNALNAIITMFDADLCIVSTWARPYDNSPEKLAELRLLLERRGIIVNGLSVGDIDHRAKFILEEKQKGCIHYIVIDDEAYEYWANFKEIGYNRIVHTNPLRGLDNDDAAWLGRLQERLKSNYPDS